MPLNDAVVLASKNASIFINRFEYMDIFRKAYPYQTFSTSDSIDYTYPKKSLLTFLKEKGVKLNKEQEAIRLRQEKLAGTTVKIIIKQFIDEKGKTASLYEKEQKLVQEYATLCLKESGKKGESQQDKDRLRINIDRKYDLKKDSIIAQLYHIPNPLLWQIAKVRSFDYDLGNIKDSQIAHEYVDSIKQTFSEPFLVTEAERILEKKHPKDMTKSYQLPEGTGRIRGRRRRHEHLRRARARRDARVRQRRRARAYPPPPPAPEDLSVRLYDGPARRGRARAQVLSLCGRRVLHTPPVGAAAAAARRADDRQARVLRGGFCRSHCRGPARRARE